MITITVLLLSQVSLQNTGEKLVEDAKTWVKSLFTPQDECKTYIRNTLKAWELDPADFTKDKTHVTIDLREYEKYIVSPQVHIDRVFSCASKNPYLVKAVEEGRAAFLKDFGTWNAAKLAKFKEVTKTAICHSNYYELLTMWVEDDFPRAKRFFDQLNTFIGKYSRIDIAGLRWYNYEDAFGNIKINTVFIMINGIIDDIVAKKILSEDKKACDTRFNKISLNIAEAMYFDAQEGYLENAISGAPLVVTPTSEITNAALEVETPRYTKKGTYLVFQPFPDMWADLYSVWNLAFTAKRSHEFPMYWAKLLTPPVGCYRELKGSYIFRRGMNLALHVVNQVVVMNKRKALDPDFDIRVLSFVKSFGITNKASSIQYFNKVQAADTDKASKDLRQKKYEEVVNVTNGVSKGTFSSIKALYNAVQSACSSGKSWWDSFKGFFTGKKNKLK